jgi:predicted RNase H-like nuclease (RuvC/YqgF family)
MNECRTKLHRLRNDLKRLKDEHHICHLAERSQAERIRELEAENRALREQVRELEAKNKDLGIRSMLNNGRAFRLADYIANSGMCAFCPAYDEFCMADGACRLVDCIEAIYKWADKQAAKEAGE